MTSSLMTLMNPPAIYREKKIDEADSSSSSSSYNYYYKDRNKKDVVHRKSEYLRIGIIIEFFRSVFLPQGYPRTVSADYTSYQIWDTVQAFFSSLAGSLSTRAMFRGVGVGREDATPLAAAVTWLTRDGAGMIGRILFAWARGRDLDSNCKKWRIFADVANDTAMALEIMAPLLANDSVLIQATFLCGASVVRSLVGVAGGATRVAITQHQALDNNVSDVAAKDGSQETLVNLFALIINLSVLPLLPEDHLIIVPIFALLTFLHLYANVRAVRSLVFRTLNRERLSILLNHYFNTNEILSIEETNSLEPIWFPCEKDRCHGYEIDVGASASSFITLPEWNRDQGYAVELNRETKRISALIWDTNVDLIRVYFDCFREIYRNKSSIEYSDFQEGIRDVGWKIEYSQITTSGWIGEILEDKKAN